MADPIVFMEACGRAMSDAPSATHADATGRQRWLATPHGSVVLNEYTNTSDGALPDNIHAAGQITANTLTNISTSGT